VNPLGSETHLIALFDPVEEVVQVLFRKVFKVARIKAVQTLPHKETGPLRFSLVYWLANPKSGADPPVRA